MNINISTEMLFDIYEMYQSKYHNIKKRSEKCNKSSRTTSVSERKSDLDVIREKYLYMYTLLVKSGLREPNRIRSKI